MIGGDSRLRFRVWINTHLVEEVWLDVEDEHDRGRVQRVRDRHLALAADADTAGRPWLIEIYDPAQPEERAYLRFGTDRAGMVHPISAGAAGDVLARYRHRHQ